MLGVLIHRDTFSRINPVFPFDFAWYLLQPYLPLQGKIAAITKYARVLISGGVNPCGLVVRKLNRISVARRRSVHARSYKLLGSNRAVPQRAVSYGSLGLPKSLALAGARWIMRQVKKVLRRAGKMLLMRQDIL